MSTSRWRTIMVVVTNPFAREQLAATKAAAAARRCGARVVLFNTFMIPQPIADAPMDSTRAIMAAAIRQRHTALRAIAKRLRLPRNTEFAVRWDYPIDEAIVRQVRRTKPDVLISESHRHGRFARLLLANTDWLLIRDCPCPVWFVRSPTLTRSPQLLVAVDPRHAREKPAKLDDRLLQAAQGFARQLGGEISVVHACARFDAALAGSVTKLAGKYDVDAADCVMREGAPDVVVATTANRRDTDVLVMGAVSRSFLSRPVIGNTAERVIDQVDCDVFIVKPAGFKR